MPPANPSLMASEPPGLDWTDTAPEQRLYPLAGRAARWFAGAAAALCSLALYIGFFQLPRELAQGDHYRILLIHLPAAWMSICIYFAMAAAAAVGLLANHRLAAMLVSALAPTGGMFAFLAMWTGSLWVKPSWGVWWVWDAQLTVELMLLGLFLTVTMLHTAVEDVRRADRAAALLAVAGLIALPIIYASMTRWGEGVHGGALAPGVMDTLRVGMLVMGAGLAAYSVAAALTRLRTVILERDRRSEWVSGLAGE